MPLTRSTVGKTYEGEPLEVTAELVELYADATDFPMQLLEGGLAPPLFAVRPLVTVLFAAILDEEVGIDLKRLVHGEQDMRFYAPIRVGDVVSASAVIDAIEERSSGETLLLVQRLERDGQLVCEANSNLFVRALDPPSKKGDAARAASTSSAGTSSPQVIHEEREDINRDQSLRYADASGDHNPLHKDPEFAKAAGLPDVILHGLCTMAIASRAVIQGPCNGNLQELSRLSVRFAKPVFPGQVLTTRVFSGKPTKSGMRYAFETTNGAGDAVLTKAIAEVSF